jgi:hypothetical protein
MLVKLGEALARRGDLQKRLAQLGVRLRESAVVQEGTEPPESPDELLGEVDRLADELERLIAVINQTNSSTRLPSGVTLTEGLARRDVLALRHGVLRQAAEAAAQAQSRYGRSEIRLVRLIDVAALRARLDDLARERRELDTEIQALNWTVDLIED